MNNSSAAFLQRIGLAIPALIVAATGVLALQGVVEQNITMPDAKYTNWGHSSYSLLAEIPLR